MKAPTTKTLSITALIMAIFAICCSIVNARNYARILYSHRYTDPLDMISDMIGTSDPHHTPRTNNYVHPHQHQSHVNHRPPMEKRTFTPPHTVFEEDGTVVLEMEVPGVLESDIEIDLEDNSLLRVKGKRTHKKNGDGLIVQQSEFDFTFRLNDNVDMSQLQARLSAGILRVQVPNKVKKVQRIPIETTTPSTGSGSVVQEGSNNKTNNNVPISLHVQNNNDEDFNEPTILPEPSHTPAILKEEEEEFDSISFAEFTR